MAYSRLALGALCAALATAAQSAQVKWEPLSSTQQHVEKPSATPAPVAAPVPSPATSPAVAPALVAAPMPTPAPPAAPAATPVVQVATVGQQPLALTCVGAGTASKASFASVWGYGGWAMAAGHHDRGFNEQVDVRLFNGDDRIRMPRTMLPGIHGGDHGWFKLDGVTADARSIHASAAVGILNNPKVYIDRVTGTISISGKSGDYAGECQVIDANAPAKF